jgi:hypothetical protein
VSTHSPKVHCWTLGTLFANCCDAFLKSSVVIYRVDLGRGGSQHRHESYLIGDLAGENLVEHEGDQLFIGNGLGRMPYIQK